MDEHRLHGAHVIGEWLRARPSRIRVLLHDNRGSAEQRTVLDLAQAAGVATRAVSGDEIERHAASKRHQGLVAECAPFPYAELDDLLPQAARLLVIVDQLQDPHNLGALIRTAAAAGAGALIAPKDGCVGVTPAVEAASAGCSAWLPICRVTNLVRSLDQLKEAGYWTVGLMPRAETNLYRFEPPDKIALVLGGEGGVRPLVARQFDFTVSIPMSERVESLNASVAGALAMYQLTIGTAYSS